MNKSLISLTLIGLMISACGAPTKKNPVENYDTSGVPVGTEQKPRIEWKYATEQIPVEKEKIVEVKTTEYVPKEVAVEKPVYVNAEVEQLFIKGQLFQVVTEDKKSIKFYEGQKSEINIVIEILQGTASFDAVVDGLGGATLTPIKEKDATNKKTYKLSWTGKIPTNDKEFESTFSISLQNLKFLDTDAKVKATLEKQYSVAEPLVEVPYIIRRPENIPMSMKIVGLTGNRKQGEQHSFQVEVTAPGSSDSLMPQVLIYPYDVNTNPITSSGALMNGALYVRADQKKPFENLGNGKWVFNYIYDTTGSLDQTAFNKNMTVKAGAKQLLVSVIFTAITPAPMNTSTDPVQLKFAIDLNTPQAPAAVTIPAGMKMNAGGR